MKVLSRSGVLHLTAPIALGIVLLGCAGNPEASNAPPNSNDQPGFLSRIFDKTTPVMLPEGTALVVVLNQSISTAANRSGDSFQGNITSPVVVDGKTVIPKDAVVKGHVVDAQASGRLKGVAHLDLTLDSLEVNGKSYEVATSDFGRAGKNHNKRNGILIGGGAGVGAIIGAVAGGGAGALIGSAAGAGAGTAGAAYTGKKDIRLPAETKLSFRLARSVTIDVKKT